MDSRPVIVTGANRGIGHGITKILASEGYPVIMACRNLEKSREAFDEVRAESRNDDIHLLELDLASFRSIRAFSESIRRRGIEISALVNNAGVLSTTHRMTVDGYELTMGVNYLGHYLLTLLLLPAMSKGKGQILNISSIMYRLGEVDSGIFLRDGANYNGFRAYADSKLALELFSLELAKRLEPEGIRVNSADPGIVSTNMIRFHKWFDPITDAIFRPLIKNEARGAEAAAFLLTDPGIDGVTGRYFVSKKERKIPGRIADHPYREALWRDTERIVGL